MAAQQTSAILAEALHKLEQQLTCSICTEQYTHPKILPCFHSFCLHCLRGALPGRRDNDTLVCPTCRSSCQLPRQGVDGLPPSFTINNLTEVYNLLKKVSGKGHASCNKCQRQNGDRYCEQCDMLLCQLCLQLHNGWFTNHEVLDLNIGFIISGSFNHTPIIGQESALDMSLSLEDDSPAPVPSSLISCYLTPPTNDSSLVQCTVKGTSQTGHYSVVFTPHTRGSHQLIAKLPGRIFQGNPVISIPVTVPVKARGSVVNTITGLRDPYGIAVSDDGQVFISAYSGHNITVVTSNGDRVKSFGSRGNGRGQLNKPTGIAITSKGTLLVADSENDRLQEFTMDGDCVSCVGGEGNGPLQFNDPRGIDINKTTGQVYVADCWNQRVQVLNADLTFSHSFGRHSSASEAMKLRFPNDIAIDSQGFVYVTDTQDNRIQRFVPNGMVMSVFADGLSSPLGITIDNDNLYVTEGHPSHFNHHRISVFSIDTGELIYRFTNDLRFPRGCALNKTTGDLYVCDAKKVYVF